ncbi:gamma-glutamylcyclotransferase family protein [Microbacterium sp. BG28]|uniref:gamma-glutamylcyclotransferase family protein n=1 Tax=Microbacterium sp. BG28 TaxID=3097356 RepID=UPI002A59E512|nr:gamma-glutamylcyclotransferase family protein [Microbacterium sp. BG28]MDY0828601.1 gamma-glutamylcyclotransferase family protein [Microbacterium sp. BG28]
MSTTATSERLFSYGTLLLPQVQLDVFGRRIDSTKDVLAGYHVQYTEIEDTRVVALSGLATHPVLRRTGNTSDKVTGRVLALTLDELDAADEYEVSLYTRVAVVLQSGRDAWVYVG